VPATLVATTVDYFAVDLLVTADAVADQLTVDAIQIAVQIAVLLLLIADAEASCSKVAFEIVFVAWSHEFAVCSLAVDAKLLLQAVAATKSST
jgi:hypothetical protein